jgi:hypothetical protein
MARLAETIRDSSRSLSERSRRAQNDSEWFGILILSDLLSRDE